MPSEGWQLQCQSDEEYEKNLAYHQRRNELLMDLEGCSIVMWQGKWVFDFEVPYANDRRELSSTDLRIIAEELDRRNGLDKAKSLAHTPTSSAKD